jgi:putative transposase
MEIGDLIRQGKIRRHFAARKKWTLPRFVSHITQRAAGKEPLFLEESDYLFMLSLLKDASIARSLHIYAFCLLPNHILCSPEGGDLPDTMRDLFSRYARKFNIDRDQKIPQIQGCKIGL